MKVTWSIYNVLYNSLTDTENGLVVAKGEVGRGGIDWEFGIGRYKLLYTKWINKKTLLYSTGNYIQYPVINHNGKGYEKIYICVTLLIPENNTTL